MFVCIFHGTVVMEFKGSLNTGNYAVKVGTKFYEDLFQKAAKSKTLRILFWLWKYLTVTVGVRPEFQRDPAVQQDACFAL